MQRFAQPIRTEGKDGIGVGIVGHLVRVRVRARVRVSRAAAKASANCANPETVGLPEKSMPTTYLLKGRGRGRATCSGVGLGVPAQGKG